jgi:ABC-type nitrate/sulfonate/bicarbonate transport system substrate-binding protein
MVMREKGRLEKVYAEKGVEVRWHKINNGSAQTQAMAAGSLDIASVINSTSVILANAAGNRVHVAGIVSRPVQTFALMVRKDGPDIAGLKGKTIAGPKGSVLHQMLVAVLAESGMSIRSVNFINMELPEARSALLSGRVDGALQAGSLIIRNEEAGLRILATADGYVTPLLLTAVRPAFAEDHPDLLKLYLDVQAETCDWINANLKEAVFIGSRCQGIDEEDGMKLFQWSGMAVDIDSNDMSALAADVDFLYEQGMIEKKINPEDFFLWKVQ